MLLRRLLLLLPTALTLALPGGGGGPSTPIKGSPNHPLPPEPPNLNATHMCKHRYRGIWSNYKLYGYGWNITNETQPDVLQKRLQYEINEAAAETKWKYSEFERDGKMGFNISVSFPGGFVFGFVFGGPWFW